MYEAGRIDFQVVQLPLRSIIADRTHFRGTAIDEDPGAAFEQARALLMHNLAAATEYLTRHGVLTFLLNFPRPQQNPLGRLQDRYPLHNPVCFIEEPNRILYAEARKRGNLHVVDIDGIASCLGKRHIQDDTVTHLTHGSTLGNLVIRGDDERIEPLGEASHLLSSRVGNFHNAVYEEVLGAYRTVRQDGTIKLVIFDLDDTLWRGMAAEMHDCLDLWMVEGWPLGLVEAAGLLRKRGVLLAIVSKNDEAVALETWEQSYGDRFPIGNFVACRIDWRPKSENIWEIVDLVHVTPESVLFVDDNPAERGHVREAIPGIRVLGGPAINWRRQLLWLPELQRAEITAQSREALVGFRGVGPATQPGLRRGH